VPERWEHGSDFELSLEVGPAGYPWDGRPHRLLGSGRHALRALLEWGRDRHGWDRFLVPSYFCQHTLGSLTDILPMAAYPCSPVEQRPAALQTRTGDVVLAVSVFQQPILLRVDGPATVIEDHSHGPASALAMRARADYAIASLRKTLPLPDGGVAWSPNGRDLPDEPSMTGEHRAAALMRLSGMLQKRHYLDGAVAPKDHWRPLAIESERRIGDGPASGISDYSRQRLASLPVVRWARRRARDRTAFREALGDVRGARILDVPFASVLVFDDPATRDRVRGALRDEHIYASVLWPLHDPVVEGIRSEDIDLSERLLVIHADHRYGPADMARVAAAVRRHMGPRPG
jgi:hypothetical protein